MPVVYREIWEQIKFCFVAIGRDVKNNAHLRRGTGNEVDASTRRGNAERERGLLKKAWRKLYKGSSFTGRATDVITD